MRFGRKKGRDASSLRYFEVHAGFGRKLRGLKTTSVDLPDYVERLVRRWLDQRQGDEAFASWVLRAEEEDLQ